MSLKQSAFCNAKVACSTSQSYRAAVVRPRCHSRRLAVRAAAEDSPAPGATSSAPLVLTWPRDNETARDVFAFAGSLPERLNGRMAMLGFVGIALTELQQQVPAAEQLANDVVGVTLLSITLTIASLFPKFITGWSLRDLHASATTDNLKASQGIGQVLGLFDQSLELWTGRIAMIGVAGLLITEGITGRILF